MATKTCKSHYDACVAAWLSSPIPRAQIARQDCVDEAFSTSDGCKMGCVQQHGQGVTCDAYMSDDSGWGKQVDDGTVQGAGCCNDEQCVTCEVSGHTECTFGDDAEGA
jgi:hypothetical protein